MATRSAIGYELPSGKIRAVYCHWDGYPEHQLPILHTDYNSLRKVQALIRPGSMSSLRTEQLWESDSTFDPETKQVVYTPRRDPQPLYHHERGDGPWNNNGLIPYSEPPKTFADLNAAKAYWRDSCCEWLYVFHPGASWTYHQL